MKEKINKLLESWGIGNDIQGRHEQKRFRDDIANEILELFEHTGWQQGPLEKEELDAQELNMEAMRDIITP